MNQAKTQPRISKPQVTQYQTLGHKDDCKAEEILQAGSKTPLGQLLVKMSKLPEVRFEKVLNVRRQICRGQYKLDEKLDGTIDRILEELLIDP